MAAPTTSPPGSVVSVVTPSISSRNIRSAARHRTRDDASVAANMLAPIARRTAFPSAVVVPYEQSRLHALAGHAERLHEDRSIGKIEIAVGSHMDLASVGKGHEPFLGRAVGPHRVDEHRGRSQQVWVVRTEDADGRLIARGQVRLQNLTP